MAAWQQYWNRLKVLQRRGLSHHSIKLYPYRYEEKTFWIKKSNQLLSVFVGCKIDHRHLPHQYNVIRQTAREARTPPNTTDSKAPNNGEWRLKVTENKSVVCRVDSFEGDAKCSAIIVRSRICLN
jgi:hypothetical protein